MENYRLEDNKNELTQPLMPKIEQPKKKKGLKRLIMHLKHFFLGVQVQTTQRIIDF